MHIIMDVDMHANIFIYIYIYIWIVSRRRPAQCTKWTQTSLNVRPHNRMIASVPDNQTIDDHNAFSAEVGKG